MKQEYDVFISYASEEKDGVARPLAEFLRLFGVRVWHDEYSLEIGDSLSESIDAGLSASRFGVVILSRSFFAKRWARRELEGLVAKEIAVGKVILPIWHGVGADDVRDISPTLANRYALSTELDKIEVIGLKILRVVRRDIFDDIQRWVLWKEKLRQAKPELVKLSDLKPSARRHETLPHPLLVRARLLHQILGDIVNQTFEEMVDLFSRDLHPQREVEIWERIAVAFLEVNGKFPLSPEQKRELFNTLLGLSVGAGDAIDKVSARGSNLDGAILDAWEKLLPKHRRGDC